MRIRLLLTHKQHEDINNKILFRRRLTKAKDRREGGGSNRDEVIEPTIEYARKKSRKWDCQRDSLRKSDSELIRCRRMRINNNNKY